MPVVKPTTTRRYQCNDRFFYGLPLAFCSLREKICVFKKWCQLLSRRRRNAIVTNVTVGFLFQNVYFGWNRIPLYYWGCERLFQCSSVPQGYTLGFDILSVESPDCAV